VSVFRIVGSPTPERQGRLPQRLPLRAAQGLLRKDVHTGRTWPGSASERLRRANGDRRPRARVACIHRRERLRDDPELERIALRTRRSWAAFISRRSRATVASRDVTRGAAAGV